MFGKEELSVLEKFEMIVQHCVVTNENNIAIKFVTTGGVELIEEATKDEDINAMLDSMGDKEILRFVDGKQMPFRYVETQFNISKLEELLKFKSIKSLSKEKALEINSDIKSKDELEDVIVYITDKEPMTNSLALAKQFDLKHRSVIEKIFELGSMYPSILMKIKYDVCLHVNKIGGRPKNEIVGNKMVVESSTTIKTQETYDTFLHIPEDVYYLFLKKLSTPKGMNTVEGRIRLVHRESKQDEYFTAFRNVRSFLHDSDVKEKELDAIIKMRTKNTKALMSTIYDYVTKYNSYHKDKHLNLVNVNRVIFNVVNYTNDINAINYIPQTEEEVKDNKTRKTKDEILQEELAAIEFKFMGGIKVGAKHYDNLIDILSTIMDKTSDELRDILREYNADNLL